MRTILTTLLILGFAISAQAADFSSINKESIASFIELMPKYKAIVMEYGENIEDEEDINLIEGSKMYQETLGLLKKYDISPEDFATFLQKVTMAFATAQMEGSGMPAMPFGLENLSSASEEEMNIVKENLEAIEDAFEDEE